MPLLETLGTKAATVITSKIATEVLEGIGDRLSPTELSKAIHAAIDAADEQVNLFGPAEQGVLPDFLELFAKRSTQELQKPLKDEGIPDTAFLVKVFEALLEEKPKVKERLLDKSKKAIAPWMTVFVNTYFEKTNQVRFQVAKEDYLEQLANFFDDVKFAGVAVDNQEIDKAERLAQIFVMPDVQEDVRDRRSGLLAEAGVGLLPEIGSSIQLQVGRSDRQAELFQEQRTRAQLERSGRKFSARQFLTQNPKKVVLLGAPGSGKTTLMSYFAVANAKGLSGDATALRPDTEGLSSDTEALFDDTKALQTDTTALRPDTTALQPDTEGLSSDTEALPLPILIRIRDWARYSDMPIPEYARQFAEKTLSVKRLPPDFFEYWLERGKALILLDGLDEVAEESKRYHIVQCIENFLGQYPHNRAIITSCPTGYKRDFFRTEEFPHYELQAFDDSKMEEFVDRWYNSRVQDTAEAQRRKESLRKALNDNDRIKLLARNPYC